MKKIFVTMTTMMLATSTFAQLKSVDWQITAGYTNSSVTDMGTVSGFKIGAIGEIALPQLHENVFANAGLEFVSKGCEYDLVLAKIDVTSYYLQIPVHVGYRYPLTSEVNVLGEAGPFFAFGLGGSGEMKAFGSKSTTDAFGDDGIFKRFDAGLGFKISAEYQNKYVLSFGYNFGLVNCINDSNDKENTRSYDYDDNGSYVIGPDQNSCKTRSWYFAIGYKF